MDDCRGHEHDGENCVKKGRVPIAGFIGLARASLSVSIVIIPVTSWAYMFYLYDLNLGGIDP